MTETGAYPNDQTSSNSSHKGFIAKFDGFGGILWSTYFGEHDVTIQGMDIVGTDRLVVSGQAPNNLPSPPTPLPGATVNAYAGGADDAFIALFDVNDQLIWRTFYGGSAGENGLCIRSAYGKIVLTGNTWSSDIPVHTPSTAAYAQSYAGGRDVYIVEFKTSGELQWSSYLGGDLLDQMGDKGLAVDPYDGDIFLTGMSYGNFPMELGTGWYDTIPDVLDGANGFIARFDGTTRHQRWISYLGGGTEHYPMAIGLDPSGSSVFVGGYTNDTEFSPLDNGYYYQPTYNSNDWDDEDGFMVGFSIADQTRTWSTLFGGDARPGIGEGERITAIMPVDGSVYATGWTTKYNDPASYFPLDDHQQSGATFNPLFNYNGLTTTYTDGFITHFCSELTTGIEEVGGANGSGLSIGATNTHFALLGLADGQHDLRIYDPMGRLVKQGIVHSSGGRSEELYLTEQGATMYIIIVDGADVAKFIPMR